MSEKKGMAADEIIRASRLMRDLEDRIPGSLDRFKDLYSRTGQAYVIGVTGSPGSGKSTLVDGMIDRFRMQGKTVGVVAVDPSSPFSGGALLGDRVRMQRHAVDEGVFIRSLATRGCLGGLCRAAQDVISVMDAIGHDIVLVETVGVGQNEVDVAHMATTSVVVFTPGMGDEIQAIKAGVIEIADILVVNKADRPGVDKTEGDLKLALELSAKRDDGWVPPIFKTEATTGTGIAELVAGIDEHRRMLEQTGAMAMKRKQRMKIAFLKVLESMVMEHFLEKMEKEGRWDSFLTDLTERRTDPYSAAQALMDEEFSGGAK